MVLMHWLERGLGQVLAPDENYDPHPDEVDTKSPFWSFVAPDPNFGGEDSNETGQSSSSPADGFAQTSASLLRTPETGNRQGSGGTSNDQLSSLVLSAAYDTAHMNEAPNRKKKRSTLFFQYCSSKTITDKNLRNMEKWLNDNADLLKARSVGNNGNCPQGYTPLMAAAYHNNEKVTEFIWDHLSSRNQQVEQLLAVDLIGKSVFHIVCEKGHEDMLRFLAAKQREVFGTGSPPPRDLTGRTPLGTLLTSPVPKAKKNKASLQDFFSPDDPSVVGTPTPTEDRCETNTALQVIFGHADMPGRRVVMEDSMVAAFLDEPVPIGFFGVFDGHGDDRQVSGFVSKHLPVIMINQKLETELVWEDWCQQAFLTVDKELKLKNLEGGSTAVVALVTTSQIVVANAGDSRCILVQMKDLKAASTLEEDMKQLSLSEETSTPSPQQKQVGGDVATPSASLEALSLWKDPITKALSRDHKPCLQEEKERVEKAGLTVFEEEFEDANGETQVISKIRLSANDCVAISRSFGDFDYKKSDVPPEEQPIVAVPEVIVHDRDPEKDGFLILACDGVWDVMTSDEVANFVVEQVSRELSGMSVADEATVLPTIGDRLLKECLSRGSEDNMTVIVVALSKAARQLLPGKGIRRLDFAEKATDSS